LPFRLSLADFFLRQFFIPPARLANLPTGLYIFASFSAVYSAQLTGTKENGEKLTLSLAKFSFFSA